LTWINGDIAKDFKLWPAAGTRATYDKAPLRQRYEGAEKTMFTINKAHMVTTLLAVGILGCGQSEAAVRIEGQVQAGGGPLANSTVTLWAASAGDPRQLAQARTNSDGRFDLSSQETPGADVILYVVAKGGEASVNKGSGDNPAITMLSVLGNSPASTVVINEMTTVASVWTHNQFIDGTAIKGHALGLKIAAGNVPSFVNLQTGGWGAAIQDAVNSSQTTTMANFATLSSLLAGCTTRVRPDACASLFDATTPPGGKAPTDTLGALQSVARNSAYRPERLFALLDALYPVPQGKNLRRTPYMPYLNYAPSAWTLPLKFTGGGLSAPGKIMFDVEGNAWTGVNFIVGSQASDDLWDGNLSKFAPNGRPLSPETTGFQGGGVEGPGFGTAIDADGNVWVTSTGGKTISLFDKSGKPISPPDGYNFGGQLGIMQGIIVAPNGDIWTLDFEKDQVVHLPKGDASKVKFYCRSTDGKPNKDSPCKLSGPFHLAIDQQDRIWITNAIGDTVTRFPASDPSKVEVLQTGGHSGKGMAIDSQGNAWIANTLGTGLDVGTKLKLLELKLTGRMSQLHRVIFDYLNGNSSLGNISMLRPDGTPAPGSPFHGGGAWGSWGVAIDGNDQVWSSNFAGASITHLCGARTETCPPGMKTGDPISPPGGYVGGGMQPLTDIGIDPAGNVWVADNWQRPQSCFAPYASEATSTLCGGNGLTVFFGMAKPVRAPQIGPARTP
jgi:streptogramin lyase